MGGRPLIAKLAQSALCGLFVSALALADFGDPVQAEPARPTAGTALFVASPLPRAQGRHHKRRLKRDTDHDGLANWVEVKRTKTNPRRRDTDRDGLTDWTELRRTKTNPRRRDTDRDGLTDWTELRRTKTNPRRADTDGDGFRDRREIRAGSNPRNPASIPTAPAAVPVVPPAAPAPNPGPGQDQPPSTPESPEEEPSPPPDTTPPQTTITASPPALTASSLALFGFAASESGSSFECRLDGAVFGACASPRQYAGLSDGSHTFEVRAIDQAGNRDLSPASFQWTVDTVPPAVSVDSGPESLTNNSSPTFAFSSEPGAGFECSIDQGAPDFGPCSDPESHTPDKPLADGEYTFRVRATDGAGNQVTATRGFTVDASAPDTTLDGHPTTPTSSASAEFEFSGVDGGGSGIASFECRRDSEDPEAWTSCASPQEYSSLGDGSHTFDVRAIDNAGNADATPATFEWTVDTVPPTVQIDSGPDGLTNNASPTFGFGSEPGATLECSIDQGTPDFDPCLGPGSHTPDQPLADGEYTFRVRATDAAANQAVATRSFEVDTAAPDAPELTATVPPSPANDNTPQILGSAPAGTTVRLFDGGDCGGAAIDAVTPAELEAGVEATVGEDSTTSFRATATTAAENTSGCSEALLYVEDSTAPETQIDSGPDGLTNNASPTFGFSSEPGAVLECSIDQGAPDFGPCSGPESHTPDQPLADGEYTFRVRATDAATNQAVATRSFEVDTAAPDAPELTATVPPSPANDNTPQILGSAPAGTTVRLFDGGDCGGAAIDTVTPAELEAGVEATVGEDSTTSFRATATTAAENTSGCSEALLYFEDSTAPETQIDSGPDNLTNSDTAIFEFSGDDPGGSGVASFQCRIDSSEAADWQTCASSKQYTELAEGSHSFEVRAVDQAGNVDGSAASHEWTVDTVPPPVSVDSGPDGLTNNASPTFGFSSEPGAGFECSIDGGTPDFGPCSDPEAHTPDEALADGEYTFRVRATDAATNQATATRSFTLDATAPETQIDSGPAALVSSDSATFEFSGDDPGGSGVASFQCKLDEAGFSACSSGIELAGLGEGGHRFEVRAVDQAGNVDGSAASHEWTVDTAPPTVQIDSGPEGLTSDNTPTFGFSAEPGATLECSIDGGTPDFGSCSSPESHTPDEPLADDGYTFRVRATDAAANQATATRSFTVDATAPETQIDSGPAALVSSDSATFEFSGDDPGGSGVGSFQCKLDEAGFSACSSGIELAGLGEGGHRFEVRAVDQAGNVDGSAASHEWTVDTVAPTTQIDSGLAALTNSTSAEFGFSGDDGGGSGVASFQCKLDEAGFSACSSGIELAGLGEGSHSFEVRAVDEAGNVDPEPAGFEWTVDTTAPQPAIDTLSKALLKAGDTSEVEWHANENGGFELRVGGVDCVSGTVIGSGAYSDQPEPHLSSVGAAQLAEGPNTLRLCLTDAAGNRGEATTAIERDTQAPDTQVDSGPAALVSSDTATFSFSGDDGGGSGVASFQCKLDEAGFSACSSGVEYAELSEGSHRFEVRAIDNAGNIDGSAASHEWIVDTVPPTVQIDSGPQGLTSDNTPTFAFGSEPGANFECSIDQGAPGFGSCSGPGSHTPDEPLADGEYTFRVRATDAATNQATATRGFTLDATAPETQITAKPAALVSNDTATFEFSGEDPGGSGVGSFECKLDEAGFSACSSGIELTELAEGGHSFEVRAVDEAGNVDGSPASHEWTVDMVAPTTQIDSGPDVLVDSGTAIFEFSGEDPGGSGVASFQCKLDEAGFSACSSGIEYAELAEGSHSFEVRAVDQAGNADGSPASREWTVDTVPPALQIESGPDGLTNNASPTFGFSSEPGATLECAIDQGTPDFGPCSAPGSHTPDEPLADGEYTFRVRATDAATNQAVATRGFEVDTAAPDAPELTATEPPSPANDNTPQVLGSAAAGTTVRLYAGGDCGGAPIATVTPAELEAGVEATVDEDSTTSFRATATTAAENTSGCSEALPYVEDSTAPETQIDSGPVSPVSSDTATFGFSGVDGVGSGVASFQCRIDSSEAADWQACASSKQYAELAEGSHTFEVRAIDNAGNVDGSAASHEWTVDTTAPQPVIDTLSKALLKEGETSEVEWHAVENGGFELRVGGVDCDSGAVIGSGAYADQPEPHLSSVAAAQLAEGPNTLRLCLTDAAGNRGEATASVSKDTDAPDTQIDSQPPPFTTAATAEFTFSGDDGDGSGVASFECRRDGGAWAGCTSPKKYAELVEGPHEFEVKAVDGAGNRDPIPASFNWTVDTTPPAVQIDSGPDGLTNDPTPTFAFSSEPGAGFECSIDSGAPDFGPCSDPGAHTPEAPLSEGPHTFRVRAGDAAGNQATETRDFEVDTTAPDAPELTATAPASPANQNNPKIFGSALAGSTVDLYSGGSCTGTLVATVSAAELEAGVEVAVPDDSVTVFRASATIAERTSGCAEPLVYVEDSTAPETTIASSPPATTYSTSASFLFEANEPGTSLECKLDGAAFAACGSPTSYSGLSPGGHSFAVRATDAAGNQQLVQTDRSWTIESPPSPAPSACAEGGTEAVTASAVRSAVQNGEDVCVTANVGDVDLSDLGARPVVVSTEGGSMEDVDLAATTDLAISRARLRAVELRNSHRTLLLEDTIGGTQASRVADQLIFMPVDNDDVVIEGNDIGWTLADDSGNTGYGCRCYGDLDRLRFVGNRLHDLAADGFQGVGGTDVLIDRNEIGPVGRNPESDEHSDNIQITGNETNLRITNNWIHHQGYFEGGVTANSGSTYIHGGSPGSLIYENNLIETAQGRTEICGLGTGGEERSNLTIRRNTWVEGGLAFSGFPGFEWDCDSGSGNVVERNIAVDADGGIEMTSGSAGAASFSANLWGEPSLVAFDAAGNCTSANCNPAGEEPIGYRKPSGVDW